MEKEIRDMNVKELKALAKERGIKRYYWLRKAQLIESLETETPPTEAPETEIMEAPETGIMEAPETGIMEAPETGIMEAPVPEIMEAPVPEIMDEPVPEIKKPVLSPDKMENISRVSSLTMCTVFIPTSVTYCLSYGVNGIHYCENGQPFPQNGI